LEINDYLVVRQLDEILPLAMKPTPSGGRTDVRLYWREDARSRWLGIQFIDPDTGKLVGDELPIEKPEDIGPYFDALATKAYQVAAGMRTKPLQH
jgi:photosystem II stability/assembly factor-like uncharacterized protein